MIDQEADGAVDGLGIDCVVVIEDEGKPVLNCTDFVNQGPQQRLNRRRLTRMQQCNGVLANPGLHRLQCRDEVGPEKRGVIVALIE